MDVKALINCLIDMIVLFQAPFLSTATACIMPPMSACGELKFGCTSVIDSSNLDKSRWPSITPEQCFEVELQTRTQAENLTWHTERASRITASQFHRIINRHAVVTDKFLSSLFSPKPFTSAATTYGMNQEKFAKEEFLSRHQGAHVHAIGFVINPSYPFLGASPDARVCVGNETGIMEVKCPYSSRYKTLEECCSETDFCLEKSDSGLKLKTSHMYWFQVQGQLLVTGAKFCIFVVFTQKDLHEERILPDFNTMNYLLQRLYDFYCNHARKFIDASSSRLLTEKELHAMLSDIED